MNEAALQVLCLTETHKKTNSTHHTTDNNLRIAGPIVRGSTDRHRGGVSLLASEGCRLRYKAHWCSDDAQVLVASTDTGLLIIGAYIAPVRGSALIRSVLEWVKPWMRSESVLLGDLNARHRRWDSDTNAYGSSLLHWAETNKAKVYAPAGKTCVTSLGASTIDLFVARSPRLDNVTVVPGIWDLITDHNLVVSEVCPPAEDANLHIPPRLLRCPNLVRKAADMYRDLLPDIITRANLVRTTAQLDDVVSTWQASMLRPWLKFNRPSPNRFRPGWSRELDHLASQRTRLLRRAHSGDETARRTAKALDREIKRRFRARQRAQERRAVEEAQMQLDSPDAYGTDSLVRAALSARDNAVKPTPAV